MSVLSHLAQELYDSVSAEMPAPQKTLIAEFLDCGEEGCAVDYTLDWAIERGRPIDDVFWTALRDYYAPHHGWVTQLTKERLEKVAHAA
jgi:hypothetical protein